MSLPVHSRRHFLAHMAASAGLVGTWGNFAQVLAASADDLQRRHKAAILLWMGGGPATIDLWDLKPGAPTGGPFRPISTTGDLQICEHLPRLAEQMRHLAVIRSMSTREADHDRGRYYLHTGFVPSNNVEYPSYGAVVSHELASEGDTLDIPPFVSIGGPSEGPGFLGMSYAPFVVDANGQVRNLNGIVPPEWLARRVDRVSLREAAFLRQNRGEAAAERRKLLDKTLSLLGTQQTSAFRVDDEPTEVRERYGEHAFGRSCLMARRLVETGVSFVEVDFGGWDTHQQNFNTLENQRLPVLDQGMSALVEDLVARGLWEDTVLIWMGEFGRTPRINATAGRDHWARSWSTVVGGGPIRGGQAIGATSADGTQIEGKAYQSQDLMASVLHALGISLDKTYTSKNGRPIKIANSGQLIQPLFG